MGEKRGGIPANLYVTKYSRTTPKTSDLYPVSVQAILLATPQGDGSTHSVPSGNTKDSSTLARPLMCNLRIHGYGSARTAISPNTSVIANHNSNHSSELQG